MDGPTSDHKLMKLWLLLYRPCPCSLARPQGTVSHLPTPELGKTQALCLKRSVCFYVEVAAFQCLLTEGAALGMMRASASALVN